MARMSGKQCSVILNLRFFGVQGHRNAGVFFKNDRRKTLSLETDSSAKPQPIIKPADLAHLEQDLFVICDDGAIRLRKISISNRGTGSCRLPISGSLPGGPRPHPNALSFAIKILLPLKTVAFLK